MYMAHDISGCGASLFTTIQQLTHSTHIPYPSLRTYLVKYGNRILMIIRNILRLPYFHRFRLSRNLKRFLEPESQSL